MLDTLWRTSDEIAFLNTLDGPQLEGYLQSTLWRQDWGEVSREAVTNHARRRLEDISE